QLHQLREGQHSPLRGHVVAGALLVIECAVLRPYLAPHLGHAAVGAKALLRYRQDVSVNVAHEISSLFTTTILNRRQPLERARQAVKVISSPCPTSAGSVPRSWRDPRQASARISAVDPRSNPQDRGCRVDR